MDAMFVIFVLLEVSPGSSRIADLGQAPHTPCGAFFFNMVNRCHVCIENHPETCILAALKSNTTSID